jgi:G3E family GTPase
MIKVTIISGFLGVGKTTFANMLLDYYIRRGERTAYIVNEFGSSGVDSALVEQKGFHTVDIVGGCICCALRGKIADAIRAVVVNFSPTRIVFEPSGIFIFEKFEEVMGEKFLKENCEIDSVITVVDSAHAKDAMFVEGNFFSNQVAHADTLILSKLQLRPDDGRELVGKLRALNERAGIWAKPWSELTDEDFAKLDFGGSVGVGADEDHDHDHDHDDHHHHDDHDHGHDHDHDHDHDDHGHKHLHEDLDSITITPRDLDEKLLAELRRMMKDGAFGKVYRAKGLVMYNGEAKLLQAVFDSLNMDDDPPKGICSLTFIGDGLDGEAIRRNWGK